MLEESGSGMDGLELEGVRPAAGQAVQAREAERLAVIDRVTRWGANRSDVVGVLLVGSCARGTARPESDVDLVVLTTDPSGYGEGGAWLRELSLGEVMRVREWGPVTEWRHATASGLEVELGITSTNWARTDPVDAGTHAVVVDGARPLYDPAGLLGALIGVCG